MGERMKKNRVKTFAVLALLVATITYVSLLYLNIEAYNNYCQEKLDSYPESVRPYIDFEPFIYTATGQTYTYSGLFLTVCWFTVLSYLRKKQTLPAYFLIAILAYAAIVSAARISFVAYAEETIHINVLRVYDEEIASDSWLRFVANASTWFMQDHYYYDFESDFGFRIEFHFTDWFTWDSSDNNHDYYYLLKEAINEMGWSWGKVVNGEPMHLMIVATGQEDYDGYQGFSPPDWRALIFHVTWNIADTQQVIMHEIGHQFNLTHCSISICYMADPPFPAATEYCYWHRKAISDNRYLPLTEPPPPPPPAPPAPSPNPDSPGGGVGGSRPALCK